MRWTGSRLRTPGGLSISRDSKKSGRDAFPSPGSTFCIAACHCATGLAGFALNYNVETTTDVRSELGARFDSRSAFATGMLLILRGRAAWAYEFDRDRSITSAFEILPTTSFTVFGATPARDAALVSAGAELRFANGFSALAKFDGEFGGNTQVS